MTCTQVLGADSRKVDTLVVHLATLLWNPKGHDLVQKSPNTVPIVRLIKFVPS
jgi:hypothetical protein